LRGRVDLERSHGLTNRNQYAAKIELLETCRTKLANATDMMRQAKDAPSYDKNQHGRLLLYLAGAEIEMANYLYFMGKTKDPRIAEALTDAVSNAKQAIELPYDYLYEAYKAQGNAQEDLAWLCERQGFWDLAIKSFEQARDVKTDYLQATVNQGRVHFKRYKPFDVVRGRAADLENAIHDLRDACGKPNAIAEGFHWLGLALAEKPESLPEALTNLKQALKLAAESDDVTALTYMDKWAEAWLLLIRRKVDENAAGPKTGATSTKAAADEARKDLTSALELVRKQRADRMRAGQSVALCDTLLKRVPYWMAWVYMVEQDSKKAVDELNRTLPSRATATPDDARLFTLRGIFRMNDSQEWRTTGGQDKVLADFKAAAALGNGDDKAEALLSLSKARWNIRYDTVSQTILVDWSKPDVKDSKMDWRTPRKQAIELVGADSRYRSKLESWQLEWLSYLVNEFKILNHAEQDKAQKSLSREQIAACRSVLLKEAIEVLAGLPKGDSRSEARAALLKELPDDQQKVLAP